MNEYRATRNDLLVSGGIAVANAAAHVLWNPISSYWLFASTAFVFAAVLSFWAAKEWSRLRFFVTKFYCVAAIFDLFSEGLLQPFHHDTKANVICTATMFAVFLLYWLALRPIERRFFLGTRDAFANSKDPRDSNARSPDALDIDTRKPSA
jgi:hypothetical protein